MKIKISKIPFGYHGPAIGDALTVDHKGKRHTVWVESLNVLVQCSLNPCNTDDQSPGLYIYHTSNYFLPHWLCIEE